GRIAEVRRAHVRDQQSRARVHNGEEFFLDGVGNGYVYLLGQCDHGYLADPQHRKALLRHVPPRHLSARKTSEQAASLDLRRAADLRGVAAQRTLSTSARRGRKASAPARAD